MRSFSDSVADTDKVQKLKEELTETIGQKELQLSLSINNVSEICRDKFKTTKVILATAITAQVVINAVVLYKIFG